MTWVDPVGGVVFEAPPAGHDLVWLDETTTTTWRTTFNHEGNANRRRGESSSSTYRMGCECGHTFNAETVVACTSLVVAHFAREAENQRPSEPEWEGRYGR